MSFTYLAIPYGSPDPAIVEARLKCFWAGVAALVKEGDHVVSPMTLAPAFEFDPTITGDWKAWKGYSIKLMGHCDRLVVLCLDGWETSVGVAGEIEEANRLGIRIDYMELEFRNGLPYLDHCTVN